MVSACHIQRLKAWLQTTGGKSEQEKVIIAGKSLAIFNICEGRFQGSILLQQGSLKQVLEADVILRLMEPEHTWTLDYQLFPQKNVKKNTVFSNKLSFSIIIYSTQFVTPKSCAELYTQSPSPGTFSGLLQNQTNTEEKGNRKSSAKKRTLEVTKGS